MPPVQFSAVETVSRRATSARPLLHCMEPSLVSVTS